MKIFKNKRNILTDTVETLADTGKGIGKGTADSAKSLIDINSFLYGPSEKPPEEKEHKKNEKIITDLGVDKKTKEENEKMKSNHTPLDVQAMREKQQTAEIRKRLFNLVKEDDQKADAFFKEKKQKEKQQADEEEQKKKQEKEKENQQPEEEAQGKSKAKLGQARKKASTDPHQNFEQKSNKGK